MKHHLTPLLASASLIALATGAATAQETFDLGEITVFSNQAPTAVSRTGATVEILDAEDLQRAGGNTLTDALDTLPGVSVSSNGGLGKQTQPAHPRPRGPLRRGAHQRHRRHRPRQRSN
ncbi:MAG: TonB-dependent receptor plug domain-containing protein, partial [Rhodobacteraceae bacterium]|nr:TonB-dependent receptor plug domain-containing protein [Paracoccaceae bacterium]